MANLLDELNPQQRAAVERTEGPVLILAGAGSGKTRAITYRIAHLIRTLGVPPESILAMTFTNKAAAQMKERVAALLARNQAVLGSGEPHSASPSSMPDNRGTSDQGSAKRSSHAASLRPQRATGASPAAATVLPPDSQEGLLHLPYGASDLAQVQPSADEPLLASAFLEVGDELSHEPSGSHPDRHDVSPDSTSERGPHISTFHSFCVYVLRRHIDRLGYSRSFSIYDDDDQMRLVKNCIKELGLSEQLPSPRGALAQISYAKNKGLSAENLYQRARDEETAKTALVYDLYERKLRLANALDFDDLLLKTVALFQEVREICEKYNRRFRYIMVDEYQDTNRVQYQLIRQLTLLHQNLCVVGDEDQSIYRWRGADVENILRFEEDYRNTQLVRLEQNYRSTQLILDAASAVVRHNLARKGKTLWTERSQGGRLGLFEARDAEEEGWFVASQVASEVAAAPDGSIAVLYRTNAQSRILEEAMRRQGIDYRMVGGFSFYARAEIKDALAYARLAGNLSDSEAFARVLNAPARGIGDATLGKLEELARHTRLSLWEALEHELAEKRLAPRALKALEGFQAVVRELARERDRMTIAEFFKSILERTGYLRALEMEKTPDAQARIENLRELGNAAQSAQQGGETLAEFLDRAALVSEVDNYDPNARVTLLTLHAAKGLEFSTVLMVGLEEGLLPHKFSAREQEEIEEERRLCYVGMTRAKNRLVLSWARQRRSFAGESFGGQRPSRFLREIPEELIERLNLTTLASKPRTSWANALNSPSAINRFIEKRATRQHRTPSGLTFVAPPGRKCGRWKLGARVRHPKYGLGTVIECDGDDENAKITVSFPGYGTKKLVERYAPLEEA